MGSESPVASGYQISLELATKVPILMTIPLTAKLHFHHCPSYVTVKIIPHPHGAFCTRGKPPFVARSGDVSFGDSPGVTAFDVFARRSLGSGGGLKITQTVIQCVIDPFITPFDALVTEIRVERGYSPSTPQGISPRSGRNRFQIPRVRSGVSLRYSPGTECTVGVGNYFDCHITAQTLPSTAPEVYYDTACQFVPERSRPIRRPDKYPRLEV
jgi:hypothetical protein